MGDFDVSPGWRRALIAEGGKGERMVWMQRSLVDAEDGQSSTTATLPPFFPRRRPGAAAEDVVAAMWISSGKCVSPSEAGSQWMKFERSIFGCLL